MSDKEVGKKICESVGRNLLADNTQQSLALMVFLSAAFEHTFDRLPESALDYGYLWSLFIGHRDKDPEIQPQ